MPVTEDPCSLIYRVSETINAIYDRCQKAGDDWSLQIKDYYQKQIPKIVDQIPWLNESNIDGLVPNQLVRFRGMIQDMYDPELYVESYTVRKEDKTEISRPGKYMDVAHCGSGEEILIDSPSCKISDRESYCCISIPGESPWVKEAYIRQNNNCHKNKLYNSSGVPKKRVLEEDGEMEVTCTASESESHSSDTKKFKESTENSGGVSLSYSGNMVASKEEKFPFSQKHGVVCVLKVYENDIDIRLNDVVEVVGVLSMDGPLQVDPNSIGSELEGKVLPHSLAPRLHAVTLEKRTHHNPLLPSQVELSNLSNRSTNLRELLLPVLRLALLGDHVASEYVVSHLVSTILCREDIAPIGKFTLNLSGLTQEMVDQGYPKRLFDFLQSLVTLGHYFPMTLENMNKLPFIPKKDYQENCLKSGLLQLPPNIHLVLDETQLSNGQLDSTGLNNLAALSTLVRWQKVDYDFQFHKIEQQSNVPVLILSEGRAMINSDYHVRLCPEHTDVGLAFDQVSDSLSDDLREQIRIHLTLARLMPYSLTENMQKMVQDDFVSSRQHSDGLTAEGLHNLLTLARLLAQSSGKLELSEEIWTMAKSLECDRKRRLSNN